MRSVRTSYAFSFQDMWKWNSARSSTSRKAGYALGSKIIEKLIFNQLFEYLMDSNLLADWQNGLRPVHSTLWPPCLEATSSENVKKGLISKTTTLHVHHAFLYISLPSPHDYGVKIPNFTFYGGRKQATTNFSFSFKTWVWSPRNQLQGNSPTYDISSNLE